MTKKILLMLLLCCSIKSFCQEKEIKSIQDTYERFLKTKETDTLLTKIAGDYACSEDYIGYVAYYYKEDTLQLITHEYKQGYYDDFQIEHYFIQNQQLVLKVNFTEILHMNTYSNQNEQGTVAGVEKVLELVEQRLFLKNQKAETCYERKFGKKMAEWDSEYFKNLPFHPIQCIESPEDINTRYKILQKAARVFRKKVTKQKPCIFYVW